MLNRLLLSFLLLFSIGISKAQPPDPGVFIAFMDSPDTARVAVPVAFSALYSSATPPVTNNWDFGDGAIGTNIDGDTIYHTYSTPGIYTVHLKAVCFNGDSSEVIKTIQVFPNSNAPAIDFSFYPDTPFPGEPVIFTDLSTTSPGSTITGSYWSCSVDGYVEHSGLNHQYIFDTPGMYLVNHRVANSLGISATAVKAVMVLVPSGFKTKQYCAGTLAELNIYVSSASYQWQVSTDSGLTFTNINPADTQYRQSTQPVLQIVHTPASFNGYLYRCITDTSNTLVYKIQILPSLFTGTIDSSWENPANWSCGTVPGPETDVIINSGTVTVNSNAICRTLTVNPGANIVVTTGFNLVVLH